MRSGQLPIANRLQPDLLLLDHAPRSPLESEFYDQIVLRTPPSRYGWCVAPVSRDLTVELKGLGFRSIFPQ